MSPLALSLLSAAVLAFASPLSGAAPAPRPAETAPAAAQLAQQVTASPFFTVDQDHTTTGTASLVTENGQTYLVFDAGFDTARGPDVQVVLYREATIPVAIAEADYVTLAPLQSFDGEQRYLIPDAIALDEYQSVGIWCRRFNVTFGYATL